MKRKIIQLAGKTLVVSIPSKWARKYNLKKGDEIDILEEAGRIVIQGEGQKEEKKVTIDISGKAPMIKRMLGAIYKTGYTEMEILFSTSKELETAQEVIREEFIGFEIVDHRKNTILAKEISEVKKENFNTMLRRLFLIILAMGDDMTEALKQKDKEFLKTIALRDKDVNKIADFCRRVLNQGLTEESFRTPPAYFIVEQLEKISDMYRDLCLFSNETKYSFTKSQLELFKEISDFFRIFYENFFKFEMGNMVGFAKKRYELRDKMPGYFKGSKQELKVFYFFNSIVESTFDMNGPLMGLKL